MSTKQQAAAIKDSILATFRQAFPGIDEAQLNAAATAASNNAAMALQTEEE